MIYKLLRLPILQNKPNADGVCCVMNAIVLDMDKDIVSNVVKYCKCQIMSKDTIEVKQGEKGKIGRAHV